MQGIPQQLKAFKFAQRNLSFLQTYSLEDFPRIRCLVNNPKSVLLAELNFFMEEGNIPCVKGKAELEVSLECQRCLEAVTLSLKPTFKLAFIKNEQQAEVLDTSFETILGADETLSAIEFITDEVLISIPMIPTHSYECQAYQDSLINTQIRENPFAILEQFKTRSK
jgi:uncharacterized protein